MVKPSKSMQPEHVDLQQASKRTGKGPAFGEDSFRNYMALKIATQRQQFGLVLPPPPTPKKNDPKREHSKPSNHSPPRNEAKSSLTIPTERLPTMHHPNSTIFKRSTLLERSSLAPQTLPSVATSPARSKNDDRSVRFADDLESCADIKRSPQKKTKMESMIGRLKKRHGKGNRRLERKKKRKREEISNTKSCRRETNVPMGSPSEDGLAELDRLFATIVDEKEAGCVNEEQDNKKKGETKPKAEPPTTAHTETSEEDGLAELDKMFASTKTEIDRGSPSSRGDNNQKDPQEQQGCLTEADNPLSTVNGDDDDDSFCFENYDGSDEIIPQQQQQQEPVETTKSPEVDEDAEELSEATTPSVSPKTMRRLRPDLFFYGIVVKVAGYTYPDNETIKRLLQKHGGDLETYETERVTHIIAQQLSTAKANLYKKARRPRPVCRPAWIVDSVKERKLLPHGKYLLIEERDQQQMGIQSMFQKHKETSSPTKTNTSPQKSSMIHKNPYAKNNNNVQSPEKQNGKPSLVDETVQIAQIAETSPQHARNHESPRKNDSRLINGKVRTIGTDPNFLDSYFSSSRLSFIGSFKQRAASTHLSNGTPSVSNSKKLIFHVDMDCFFAAVVLRNYPQYQDKPVVISHHGSRSKDNERGNNASVGHIPKNSYSECATCNYEARKYGIKKGMFLGRARELCPEVVVLMYDFEGYEEVSQQVSEILDRLASSEAHPGLVETVSCDESYVELNFDASEVSEKLYDHAFEVAESIRNEIFETTRCTASIGVGENKFLAKLGTDKAKPNKSYCVRDYRDLMKDLSLRDVHGVGWRTEKKLMEEGLATVQDVWDLGSRGETELIRILGPGTGKKIFSFIQGKDDRTITPVERKTIGAECNYGVRFDGPYGIDHFMEGLAKEVQKRMEGISMKGKKLTLKIKQRKENASNRHKWLGHGSCHNLSKSIAIPGNSATRDSKIFKKVGLSLFNEFAIADINEIRGMGITISSLESDNDSGKQTNPSGMQHWLQQSIELESMKNKEVTKEGKHISGSTSVTNGVEPTGSNRERPESATSTDATEKAVRHEESPLAVQLPPMSQIHMSQVEALPPEFQQEIRSRMEKVAVDRMEDDIISKGNNDTRIVEEGQFISYECPLQNNKMLAATPQSAKAGHNESEISTGSPLLIELPPMSQIQMSQVEMLPQELKEQIYSRMNQTPEIVDMTTDENNPTTRIFGNQIIEQQPASHRFRQTDLKRMMKLAAVRSGQEQTNISLTQLDQLPLEIRLQVVNRDNQQIGILSQQQRQAHKNKSNVEHSIPMVSNRVNTTRAEPKPPPIEKTSNPMPVVETKTNTRETFQIIDRVDVWKEDLVPLKEFLKDNCPLKYPKSIEMVVDFLSIVLKEGRLPAMVTMIRCIRNRRDAWSNSKIVEQIAQSVNTLHMELYEASLDVPWLMGNDN